MSNEQFEVLISGFRELHADIKEMKAVFYEMGLKVSTIETDVQVLKTDVQEVNVQVVELKTKHENLSRLVNFRFDLVENRLENIEHKVLIDNKHLMYDPNKHKPA